MGAPHFGPTWFWCCEEVAPGKYQERIVAGLVTCKVVLSPRVQLLIPSLGGSDESLVADDRGYIGAVLISLLRAVGHEVEGLDLGLYERCGLGPAWADPDVRPLRDIRNVPPGHMAGDDPVLCLVRSPMTRSATSTLLRRTQ